MPFHVLFCVSEGFPFVVIQHREGGMSHECMTAIDAGGFLRTYTDADAMVRAIRNHSIGLPVDRT